MKTLGFNWDEVHREAEALEHALSDEVANRIDAFLGHPKFDPHGDPIPDARGEIQRADGVTLTELPKNVPSPIRRVLDQTPEILRYFSDTGLLLGAVIEVVHEEPFEGPLTVKVGGRTVALSRTIASRIVVERR
jgi:DtxR family Mn-dependent transcriptional regulator